MRITFRKLIQSRYELFTRPCGHISIRIFSNASLTLQVFCNMYCIAPRGIHQLTRVARRMCIQTAFQCPSSRPSFTDRMWRRNALRSILGTHKHRIIMLSMLCTTSRYLSVRPTINPGGLLTEKINLLLSFFAISLSLSHVILCLTQWFLNVIQYKRGAKDVRHKD